MKPARFEHVLRVASLARGIARANRLDQERAYLAGLVHDVARDLPDEELFRLAPPESDLDRGHPLAVHGRAGRALLEGWGLWDEVVLEAVEDHTTGPRGDNPVAVAVYVADVSEPGRCVNDDIRRLAMSDLAAAFREAITSKVRYLQGRGIPVHPRTLEAYENLHRDPARQRPGVAGPAGPARVRPSRRAVVARGDDGC